LEEALKTGKYTEIEEPDYGQAVQR
jgi:hypothetical protein